MTVPSFVTTDLARLGIEPTGDDLSRLSRYLDLLLDANSRFNLTSIRDRDTAWRRHIIDSLTLLPMLADLGKCRAIDVGSGGGLPGVPLAITLPDVAMTFLESTGKKANFLRECVKDLSLNKATVLQGRAEDIGNDEAHREKYDAAVCRALGPMNVLLEFTLPFVKVGGWLFAMKGPSVEAELKDAGDALATLGAGDVQVVDAYPEDFDVHTVIVCVQKERPTPKAYPRLAGAPKHSPL